MLGRPQSKLEYSQGKKYDEHIHVQINSVINLIPDIYDTYYQVPSVLQFLHLFIPGNRICQQQQLLKQTNNIQEETMWSQ